MRVHIYGQRIGSWTIALSSGYRKGQIAFYKTDVSAPRVTTEAGLGVVFALITDDALSNSGSMFLQ